ncbi:MAG: NAD(P)(+) transhydrogenase (Re/Si-specific) subunit beta [Spirochaetia bacterium]
MARAQSTVRMPGQMNVLLAEEDTFYDKFRAMDQISPNFPQTDVTIALGANDVVTVRTELDRARTGLYTVDMRTVTTREAKTHLSQLIREVQAGETVVILRGKEPVAQLTGLEESARMRPRVGTITSESVRYTADAFQPLSDEQLRALDL